MGHTKSFVYRGHIRHNRYAIEHRWISATGRNCDEDIVCGFHAASRKENRSRYVGGHGKFIQKAFELLGAHHFRFLTPFQDKNLAKLLQRGEDPQFDQLLSAFGSVAEHCLPSLLTTLLAWHKRQLSDIEIKGDLKRMEKIVSKLNVDMEHQLQRRETAVEFLFCLALIEILRQLPFHPGHEDIIKSLENLAFKHFKYRDG